jgi:hypothetical protein
VPNLDCERVWQVKRWDGEWVPITAVSDRIIVMENGQAMFWRNQDDGFMPDETIELRYSIWLQERWYWTWQMMPWKPGDILLLLLDAALPDVSDAVREALAGRR